MTTTPSTRFWLAWFTGLMCGVCACGLVQLTATTDAATLLEPSREELIQQLAQETSDRKAWQLESKRWMKRWGECRDNGRDYFREALDAAVEKERAFQEARK